MTDYRLGSRQVSWWPVYEFADQWAKKAGLYLPPTELVTVAGVLIAGTPAWSGLNDDDPTKLAALVMGGVREALAHDARQEAMAVAAGVIRTAPTENWSTNAYRCVGRTSGPYIPRKQAS